MLLDVAEVVNLDASPSAAARWLEDSAWLVRHLLRAGGEGDAAVFDRLLALLETVSTAVDADAVAEECRRLARLRALIGVVPAGPSLGPLQDAWYADCTAVAAAGDAGRRMPAGR